jgi:hypothetical protein
VNTLTNEVDLKTIEIENDFDIRVESLIDDIHKCREDFKSNLNKYKEFYKK